MENDNQQQQADAAQETEKKGEVDKTTETTDYKAELEKVKTQLGQAEHVILKLKKEKEDEELGEDNQPDSESVQEIARKEAGKILIQMTEAQAKAYAKSISENPDEAELIMFHYKNSIVPTGNFQEDIDSAKLLANKKRIGKDLEQLRRAALSKETKGQQGGDGGQKQPQEEEAPALSDADKKVLRGFKWDSKRKGWVGPSGRFHSQAEIEKSISK